MSLLPVEVPPDTISDPTSRIITPQVVKAYIAAAGDVVEAVSCKGMSCAIASNAFFAASVLSSPRAKGVHVGCESQPSRL